MAIYDRYLQPVYENLHRRVNSTKYYIFNFYQNIIKEKVFS